MNPQTSQTNENGEYEIKDVKPGRYTLMVMRNGYVSQTYGQKSTDLMSPNDVAHPRHAAHRPGGRDSQPGKLSDDPRRRGGGADYRSEQ